jgi:hypothetical protein
MPFALNFFTLLYIVLKPTKTYIYQPSVQQELGGVLMAGRTGLAVTQSGPVKC